MPARPLPPAAPEPDAPPQDDGVRWLALLIRQGLLLIVVGIEVRFGLKRGGR